MKKFIFSILVVLISFSLTYAQDKGDKGISVQGGIAVPTGDFGDVYNLGFGGKATFFYHLNKNMALTGTAGYLTWSRNEDYGDGTFSTIPVLVGVRYLMGQGNFKPYVSGEAGIFFSSYSYDMLVFNGFTTSTQTVDDSGSDFGVALGGGFLMPIGNMKLDVSAQYDIIFTSGSSTSYLGIFAGVAFPIK